MAKMAPAMRLTSARPKEATLTGHALRDMGNAVSVSDFVIRVDEKKTLGRNIFSVSVGCGGQSSENCTYFSSTGNGKVCFPDEEHVKTRSIFCLFCRGWSVPSKDMPMQ